MDPIRIQSTASELCYDGDYCYIWWGLPDQEVARDSVLGGLRDVAGPLVDGLGGGVEHGRHVDVALEEDLAPADAVGDGHRVGFHQDAGVVAEALGQPGAPVLAQRVALQQLGLARRQAQV